MVRAMLMNRRIGYFCLATLTAIAIMVGQVPTAQALKLGDLIPRILPKALEVIQLANISDAQEMELGSQANASLTKKQLKLSDDSAMNRYINQIGQRLVAHNKRSKINYTFQVVADDSINAAATLGGYVYVNRGLIKAADNEAQLASVIAHEIGHVEGRHTIEQAKNSALAQTGAAALKLDRNQIVGLGMQIGLNLPRSRRFEFDADERGLRMMNAAGYAPQETATFMKKLDQGGKGAMPRWLSSHPETMERVKRLQALAEKISNPGRDGTDAIAYAKLVGKPVPAITPTPIINPTPTQSTPAKGVVVPVTPTPAGRGEVIVPTE
jgi:beta-barrel assembly-enhancing protease